MSAWHYYARLGGETIGRLNRRPVRLAASEPEIRTLSAIKATL